MREFPMMGRFELRRVLGQGAQSTVWLGFDPRMEREVAIKVMRPAVGTDEKTVAAWLQEARSVGRVKHPNIVPVYEADMHASQPYLVFEYVDGQALDQVLRKRGALPSREAVALAMEMLDALAVAHAAGVVHRDIKPSNLLVDTLGHCRVLDFGIAARVEDRSSAHVTPGTIGYLSPEAASGAAAAASMDIFAVGVVLAEMITGAPLLNERDAARAIHRVATEQLRLPENLAGDVNDALRAIVMRALAKDPSQRFGNAREFFFALDQWCKPDDALNQGSAASTTGSSTVDFLLRRMRHKSDFPALSDAVLRIQRMVSSDNESINTVTNAILKDVALTNKLLRLVNSAHFGRGGNISTVSRAVTLVGFNGIRNLALSLVMLEHMQDKAHAGLLKEEFLRALMAGSIGAELCPQHGETEEVFIGSVFQELGRLLVQFYFPEEAQQIRHQMQDLRAPMPETRAASQVLGLTYEELGLGVAKVWALPQGIQRCMRKPRDAPPLKTPADWNERMRWVALASNEIADALLHCAPQEVDLRISLVAKKYGTAIGADAKEVHSATLRARQKLIDLAGVMEIRVNPTSNAAKLLTAPDIRPTKTEGDQGSLDVNLDKFELHATQPATDATGKLVLRNSSDVADALAAGIQDITNAMAEDFKLTDVLRMILETMYRALAFDRIIFCMRDAKAETITGRFGLGKGVERYVKDFKLPLKATTPDLFAIVCMKSIDTMISDASELRVSQRLPEWYKKTLNAPTFLLLPVSIKGAPFGLIYADKTRHGSLELDQKELSLLRTLRNQAVMAFKQSN